MKEIIMELFIISGHLDGCTVVTLVVEAESSEVAEAIFEKHLLSHTEESLDSYIDSCLVLSDAINARLGGSCNKKTELTLRSDIYQPKLENGKNTGLLEYVKQRSLSDLEEQLVHVLKSTYVPSWGHSAFGAVEHISYFKYPVDKSSDIPPGGLKVMVSHGNNEGFKIDLLIGTTDIQALEPVLSMKFLTDRYAVWELAKLLEDACENGYYGY